MREPKDFKIGIVDDHVQTAVSLSQILENEGFKTFQAYEPKEAIAACKKEKPDLLLLDIRLNGMTGFEIADRLPGIKVLFLTGYDIDDEEVARHKNAVGVMQKPVDLDDLVKKVREALDL